MKNCIKLRLASGSRLKYPLLTRSGNINLNTGQDNKAIIYTGLIKNKPANAVTFKKSLSQYRRNCIFYATLKVS
jgi:hypothetical protein